MNFHIDLDAGFIKITFETEGEFTEMADRIKDLIADKKHVGSSITFVSRTKWIQENIDKRA